MPKIKKLPLDIVAKIAAGEVIERPAYAVKELIENSIDAKASFITIHIEESGLKRIQVIDNGVGMSREDLKIAYLAHTTSKINDEQELVGIKTLGFRGEALASIAAISHLTIQSRTKTYTSGNIIEIRQGNIEHIGSIGTPPGTIVTVDNLFYSVPVRKKFLKSGKTEFRHITDIVLQFALAYPRIHFTLTHNKKTVFDLPIKDGTLERASLLFGQDTLSEFLPVKFSDSYFSLLGFIGKPQVSARNNQQQFLFINNRSVSDKLIALAIKESFGTLLPSSATPVFQLHITIPYETVDVNVHPRKEQINFINNRMIFDLVKQAISETLMNNNITYHLETFDNSIQKGETTSLSATTLKDIVLPWNRTDEGISLSPFLAQVHQTYILTINKNGIVFVDQHAAHERILFEKFLEVFETEKKQKKIYTLPKPLHLSFSFSEKQLIEHYKQLFENIGFSFDEFGGNTILLRNIPHLFKGRKVERILKDILADLLEEREVKSIDTASKKMLSFLSCRSAVKSGDVLTNSQIQTILIDLEKTPNNTTCPHGRPTRITLEIQQLDKQFRRK